MQEDIRKNFVLLSKVAKENKYAQEYLGLLARRGDIGSIRIGKRWYTTTEWFSEFLQDAEMRKEEMKTSNSFLPDPAREKMEKIEISKAEEKAIPEKNIQDQCEVVKIAKDKVNLKIISLAKEKLAPEENDSVELEDQEVKITAPKIMKPEPVALECFAAEKKLGTVNLRTRGGVKPMFQKTAPNAPKLKINTPRKENRPLPPGNFLDTRSWKIRSENLSPNFVPVVSGTGFFPKFAFAMSVVLSLFLLIQAGWVYRDELKGIIGIKSGIVAGSEDSRADLDTVRNSSAGFLENQGEKVRENISLSRVLIRAAMEKSNEPGKADLEANSAGNGADNQQ